MRIICLEEHMADPGLAKASAPFLERLAPYQRGLNTIYQDDPDASGENRPLLQQGAKAVALAAAAPNDRIGAMDAAAIDTQVLSYPQYAQGLPAELARQANDRLSQIAKAHPDRFGGFSALPWQDVDAAVAEIERSVHELGLAATMIAGPPDTGMFVDAPRFAPILAKLEELRVPLYIHPAPPLPAVQQAYYSGFSPEIESRLSTMGWGWHNEAGIQVIRLILSGTLDRYPDLRVISGHWGEFVPFFLHRMDDTMPPGATGLRRTISQTYRDQVYVTPSGMLYLPEFEFCRQVVGIDRMLFAIDYPYLTMTGARDWLETLPVSEADREAFAFRNAEQLLRL